MQNNKRYWLKGIYLAFVVFVIWLIFLITIRALPMFIQNITHFFVYIPAIFAIALHGLFFYEHEHLELSLLFLVIFSLIEILIIGGVMGFMYGKIKNRDKITPQIG